MAKIVAIVEGDGEVEAVPLLIRRIASVLAPLSPPTVLRPIRVRRHRILKEGELERYVSLASARVEEGGGILILLDANGDCPARIGPAIVERARAVGFGRPIEAVLANCEYEAWLLAAAESIAGTRGILPEISAPPEPESIRGAKEWIDSRMRGSYRPTADQAALTAGFDMEAARRRSASFDKMWRATAALLR